MLLGESCQDETHFGTVDRISPEAPVPVFDFERVEVKPGMAANVYQNLKAFGCNVEFVTNDSSQLVKRRFVDSKLSQQLLREDIGTEVDPLYMLDIPPLEDFDAIVFSDYAKGLISWKFAQQVCREAKSPIFVDSKKIDLTCYPNSIIKINQKEYDDGPAFCTQYELIVTKAREGAIWRDRVYPAPKVSVYDVSGAGDVFHATLAVVYTLTKRFDQAITCAVRLASKSVAHVGTYCITEEDIMEVLSESIEFLEA